MSARSTITIGSLATLLAILAGVISGTMAATEYVDGAIAKRLQPVVDRQAAIDTYLVKSTAALCRATPKADCPDSSGLVRP